MATKVTNAHLTLNVKNSENVFVSAFSGYLIFGEIELLCFTKKSISLPICKYVEFFEDLTKVITFFDSECTSDTDESCFLCLPQPRNSWKWNGKIQQTTAGFEKTITLFSNEFMIFSFEDDKFLFFIESILQVVLFSFIFKETEIIFFQSLLENKSIFSDYEFADNEKLEKFINIFCSLHQYNKFVLKQLYYSYRNEFKFLFQFHLLFQK